MLTKFVVAFGIVALATSFAGSIPVKAAIYHVMLSEAATVNGTALQAGEYRVVVNAAQVTFLIGKESHEVAAKVETAEKKFSDNQVMYVRKGDQNTIKQICFGGSKTTLNFN